MNVIIEEVDAPDLQAKVQEAKDAGRRILAISPSCLEKQGRSTKNFAVTRYVLITQ